MPNQAVLFSLRATEINQQQPAVRLEDTYHFSDAEIARVSWKALEDCRTEHDVECRVGEPRHRTGNRRERPLTRAKPSTLRCRKLKQAWQLAQCMCAALDLGRPTGDGLVERQMSSQYL